jgi:alkanesulfonate monooxygenase SsuD/methylene tetrahydromethanopterin reductase-like flavin-dependent oxidoreductase (luciferase family)
MKTCFLCPGSYTGQVAVRGWPVPPELCDRDEAARSMDTAIRNCRLAEEAGFDWVSISEHHYSPGLMTPNPMILGAALSQATSRVKIALLGPLVPLANPVRTAEEIAMLDALSHGRVVVLFLRGTPNEHGTYGRIDAAATREMTQEGVQLIRRAWTEPKPFAHHGKFFDFPNVAVWPRTLQDPHPPIFYSGNSDESAAFAGTNRLSLAIGFAGLDGVKRQVEVYRKAARAAGWEPAHDNVLFRGRMVVAQSQAESDAILDRIAPHMRTAALPGTTAPGAGGGDPTAGFAGIQFSGDPDAVVRRAEQMRDAGVGILDVAVIGAHGDMDRAMDVFREQLADRLRAIG